MPDVSEERRNFSPEQLKKERAQKEKEEKRKAQPFRSGSSITLGEYEKMTPNQQQAAWANHDRTVFRRWVQPDKGAGYYITERR